MITIDEFLRKGNGIKQEPEYKLLMNHYAKQIEMVMGWKL